MLPGSGKYFFDINDAQCIGGVIWLVSNSKNPYPDGQEWGTGVSTCDSTGTGGPSGIPGPIDLVFDVTFCGSSTPVQTRTWGQIKTIYR
jgi:hypothetical protein